MNTKYGNLVILVLVMSLIISGCGPGQVFGPTITPSPTNTPTPTSTSTPTPTFTPTMTPSPTFTPTPTIEPPSQLSNFFEGARLTYYESFDNYQLDQWDTQDCQSVNNGELKFACANGYLNRKNSFHEGEGVMIDFKHANQTGTYWWGMYLVSGNFGQDDWRDIGIAKSDNGSYVALQKGDTFPSGFPQFKTKPDVWYRLALAIGEEGKFIILVWERDNENIQPLKFNNTLGNEWSGLEWFFRVQSAENVVIDIDNYYQFAFSKMK